MKGRIIQVVILLLVAAVIIYLFKKDILSLLNNAGQSVFKNYLEEGIIFISGLVAKLFVIIKSILSFIAGIILKIVGNATELYKIINWVLWFFGKLFGYIGQFFGFLYGKI